MDPQKKSIPFKPPLPPTGGMTGRRWKTSQQTEGLTSKDRDSPRNTTNKTTNSWTQSHPPYRAVSNHDTTPIRDPTSLSQRVFFFESR